MYLHSLFKQWASRLLTPDAALQNQHRHFRRLLELDGQAHLLMAEFSQLYHDGRREDLTRIGRRFLDLSEAVLGMIDALEAMDPIAAAGLRDYHRKFDFYARFLLAPPEQPVAPPHVLPLEAIRDLSQAGNKAVRLAQIRRSGQARVPRGFVVTVNAFHHLLAHNRLHGKIEDLLAGIDLDDRADLLRQSTLLQALIRKAVLPPDLEEKLFAAFDQLQGGRPSRVAVRSSAVGEDGIHTFAGQYLTRLDVDRQGLVEACLEVLASRYAPAVLQYRITLGLDDAETPMAVLVVPMIAARTAGVLYTRQGEGSDTLLIQAVPGLGVPLVEGRGTPASWLLDRSTLKLHMSSGEGRQQFLKTEEVREIAQTGLALEAIAGETLDIEWAVDDEGLVILQVRPLHLQAETPQSQSAECKEERMPLLTAGVRAAGGVASGRVAFAATGGEVTGDCVLVTRYTPPELAQHLGRLQAVLAEEGSVTGHFATVCREFSIPLLVQTGPLADRLSAGQLVTVDADRQLIFAGVVEVENQSLTDRPSWPYFQKLKGVCDFILPLRMTDPGDAAFMASSCRSLHDIVRYAHEKGMQAMFDSGRVADRSRQAVRLATGLPLDLRILDIGFPSCVRREGLDRPEPKDVNSKPFLALWQGLTHPGIEWSHAHFNWKQFDEMTLAGGIAFGKSSAYGSYGLVTPDYVNLNLRFGYHFTMVDALCHDPDGGYCRLRFAGGGGEYQGRARRLEFIGNVLLGLGFMVTVKADLLDARISGCATVRLLEILDQVGRLLGATKLMDMVLAKSSDVENYVDAFARGVYTFSGGNAPHNRD